MKYNQLPLLKKNNQLFFDVSKIKKHDFLKEVLKLKTDDFVFQEFGFCKDKKFFYIVINLLKEELKTETTFELSLKEINGDFFIDNLIKIGKKENLHCVLTEIN